MNKHHEELHTPRRKSCRVAKASGPRRPPPGRSGVDAGGSGGGAGPELSANQAGVAAVSPCGRRGIGAAAARCKPPKQRARILARSAERDPDFGPTLAAAYLAAEGLAVDHETLRRRRQRHRQWRERKPCLEAMVQRDWTVAGDGQWQQLDRQHEAGMAMMAMTTSSSMSVNAPRAAGRRPV